MFALRRHEYQRPFRNFLFQANRTYYLRIGLDLNMRILTSDNFLTIDILLKQIKPMDTSSNTYQYSLTS